MSDKLSGRFRRLASCGFAGWLPRDTDAVVDALRAQEAKSDAVKAAVEAEREACAKTAEYAAAEWVKGACDGPGHGAIDWARWSIECREREDACREVAAAIRARSSAPPVPAPIDEIAERVKRDLMSCIETTCSIADSYYKRGDEGTGETIAIIGLDMHNILRSIAPQPIDEAAERRAFEEWFGDNKHRLVSQHAAWSAWLARARSEKE